MLNIEQTQEVAHYLSSLGKLSQPEHEELLDHLCTDIENAMMKGQSFEEAFAHNQERWNESEVKNIHSSNQSKLTMAKLFLGALMLASLVLTANHLTKESTAVTVEQLPIPIIKGIEPPSVCPLSSAAFSISSGFGTYLHPVTKKARQHQGIDWKAPLGTPIHAAGDGLVLEAGEKGNYGNCIIIVHDDMYQTLYAHLQNIDVKKGDKVSTGQLIGKVGTTGASTGPHLHYEVIKNGVKVNPVDYLP